LKCRCLKCARIAHLDICNTSYGQKKGQEPNWQFDSWPLKVGNRIDSLTCKRRATYRWKDLDEGYNFSSDLIVIGGLHKKLCVLKVAGIWVVTISGLPLGNPGTKNHLGVASVERRRVYYKGEGGGFLQVRAVVSLVCPGCSWLVLAPKVLQLCTNHFMLILCKSMWVSKACHIFLVPSRSSSTPLYPSIMLRVRECASTPCSSIVFSLGLTFESLKELGVCHSRLFLLEKKFCKIAPKSSKKKKALFGNHELYGCKILDIIFGIIFWEEILYNFFQGLNHIHHIYIWQLLITRKNRKK
jgi:hypothetical protein